MQVLQRFSREGSRSRRGRSSSRGRSGNLYQPLNTSSGLCDGPGSRSKRSRFPCCKTQGKAFNLVVALVILANMVLIVVETDSGLLGGAAPSFDGVEDDMQLLGATRGQEKLMEARLRSEAAADLRLKRALEKRASQALKDERLAGFSVDRPLLDSGAYTLWEYAFLAFFVLEMCLRLCDLGCRGYCADPWRPLDVTIVLLGALDLGLPLVVGTSPSAATLLLLSALRTARVLRLVRLLRLCPELKVLSTAGGKAFAAVMWVGLLMLVLDFVAAVLLTSLVGSRAQLWADKADEVDGWFGSVGRSMQTLFGLMTFNGWERLAMVLGEVLPAAIVVPCLVLYVLLCSFATLSLVNGVVGDNFFSARREGEKRATQRLDAQRVSFTRSLAAALGGNCRQRDGHLNRDGFRLVLEGNPGLLARLRSLGAQASVDELLQLFDRLRRDSGSEAGVDVESLAEAIAALGDGAKAAKVFDLKYLLLAMRREAGERTVRLERDLAQRQEEQATELRAAKAAASKAQQELAAAREATSSMRQELGGLREELRAAQRRADGEAAERRREAAAAAAKVEALTVRLAEEQGTLTGKLDELAATVARQPSAEELMAKFAEELSTQLQAVKAEQAKPPQGSLLDLESTLAPEDSDCKPAEPSTLMLTSQDAASKSFDPSTIATEEGACADSNALASLASEDGAGQSPVPSPSVEG